ncbi:zinc ribbon domain-containing protein [candidate division KSB1 bacterium]|nr:zinc ribbon domain-containing protein [candidate division KSB1 bacterium]
MPIYEFKCNSCQHLFEELVLNSAQVASLHCPRCHEIKVSRVMSTFGFSSGSVKSYANSTKSCSTCGSKNCATCG